MLALGSRFFAGRFCDKPGATCTADESESHRLSLSLTRVAKRVLHELLPPALWEAPVSCLSLATVHVSIGPVSIYAMLLQTTVSSRRVVRRPSLAPRSVSSKRLYRCCYRLCCAGYRRPCGVAPVFVTRCSSPPGFRKAGAVHFRILPCRQWALQFVSSPRLVPLCHFRIPPIAFGSGPISTNSNRFPRRRYRLLHRHRLFRSRPRARATGSSVFMRSSTCRLPRPPGRLSRSLPARSDVCTRASSPLLAASAWFGSKSMLCRPLSSKNTTRSFLRVRHQAQAAQRVAPLWSEEDKRRRVLQQPACPTHSRGDVPAAFIR
jgi:hypothetical protein